MNTDFKSLEKRYGTLLATKIHEEIARAEMRSFSFYKMPNTLRVLTRIKKEFEIESEIIREKLAERAA